MPHDGIYYATITAGLPLQMDIQFSQNKQGTFRVYKDSVIIKKGDENTGTFVILNAAQLGDKLVTSMLISDPLGNTPGARYRVDVQLFQNGALCPIYDDPGKTTPTANNTISRSGPMNGDYAIPQPFEVILG